VVPGGTRNVVGEQPLRRWPIENYVAVVRALRSRDWEIVLIGGPDDAWVVPHFHGLQVADYIGKLSLPAVVSACDDCDAVISHDTGPMHLAGVSRACLVAVFGPTDPSVFLPRRAFSVAIWGGQGFACRPCYDGRHFAPCTFNGCMHQVTPELVLRELDRLLAERDQGLPSPWRIVFPEPAQEASLVPINGVRSGPR
jgi:heptosyltransferase-2